MLHRGISEEAFMIHNFKVSIRWTSEAAKILSSSESWTAFAFPPTYEEHLMENCKYFVWKSLTSVMRYCVSWLFFRQQNKLYVFACGLLGRVHVPVFIFCLFFADQAVLDCFLSDILSLQATAFLDIFDPFTTAFVISKRAMPPPRARRT